MVFREIQREIALIVSVKAKKVTYVETLYDPDLEGSLHYYAQDGGSLPTQRIPMIMANTKPFFSTLLATNRFDPVEWDSSPCPSPGNFTGLWIPRKRADILGNLIKSSRSNWKSPLSTWS